MEKLFSCIMLLVIVSLSLPGCIAEENRTADLVNVSIGEETIAPVANETATAVEGEQNSTEVNETAFKATYTVDINQTELSMQKNETVLISLRENPTTGYSWNATNSSGLAIINDTYQMDENKELMVGAGGVHSWVAKAIEGGNQTFTAVMTHVAEKPTGTEEKYTLQLVVNESASEPGEEKPVSTI